MAEIPSTPEAAPALAGSGAGKTAVKPVEASPPANPPGTLAPPPDGQDSAAKAGGNPTGRKPAGKFKHPAHTPAGKEERRKADAERKKQQRETVARETEPPILSAPPAGVSDQVAPSVPGEALGTLGPAGETFVPWTEADVRGFTDELVDLSEARRIDDFVAVAKEGGLPASLCKQLASDARYPSATKAGLKTSIARTSAKWLNKSGISARNKEEAALLFFGATIWLQGRRLRGQLEKLIADDQAAKSKAAGRAGGPAGAYTAAPPGSTPGPATTLPGTSS